VIDGMAYAKVALTRLGSKIATAAGIYADTDQRLGDHLSQAEFLTAAEQPAGNTTRDQPARDDAPNAPAEPAVPAAPQAGQAIPQLSQLAGVAGMVAPVAQSVAQSAQGAVGSVSSAGATPAQLANDRSPAEQSPDRQAQLVGDTEKVDEEGSQPEALAAGAAPGAHAAPKIPLGPTTSGRSDTTQQA
jgi:hypothetical protein